MTANSVPSPVEEPTIALVDGEPAMRRARQIMLRSERFAVRSYSSCAALLADPLADACRCIIVDLATPEVDGVSLLARMRARGWGGGGILLADAMARQGGSGRGEDDRDEWVDRAIADSSLIAAIIAAIKTPDR